MWGAGALPLGGRASGQVLRDAPEAMGTVIE
jgi:hypothetical protein